MLVLWQKYFIQLRLILKSIQLMATSVLNREQDTFDGRWAKICI